MGTLEKRKQKNSRWIQYRLSVHSGGCQLAMGEKEPKQEGGSGEAGVAVLRETGGI
jgi:hypothetical protein